MPQKRNSQGPPEVMTWGKATPILAIAAIFDALGLMFGMFWFFGPALAALFCTATVSGTVGTTIGGIACTAGATVAGAYAVAPLATFGTVMAMATGLAGWLMVGLLLLILNARIFKENTLWFAASLLIDEIPIVGSIIPAITTAVWRMYRNQIRIEKAALKKYEQEQAATQLQERRRQEMQMVQLQMGQTAQNEAQEAANDEMYAEAADNEEIPDEVRKAA